MAEESAPTKRPSGKDLIIAHHVTLYRVRRLLLERGIAKEQDFSAYNALGILPTHLHRSKTDHVLALYTLGDDLDRLANPDRHAPLIRRL